MASPQTLEAAPLPAAAADRPSPGGPRFGELDPARLLQLSRAAGEPDWLGELRAAALERFLRTGLPRSFEEDWRGTDLSSLDLKGLRVHLAAGAEAQRTRLQAPGGGPRDALTLLAAAAAGEDALRLHLARSLAADGSPPLAQLNGAMIGGGAFFHVPARASLGGAGRVTFQPLPGEETAFPRSVVVLEEGSRAALVEEFLSPEGDEPNFSAGATEVHLGPGAELDILTLLHWGDRTRGLHSAVAQVGAGARLRWYVGCAGGELARLDVELALEGSGAQSHIIGLALGEGHRHLDLRTMQHHRAPETTSRIHFGTLLLGRSQSIYRGMIRMDRPAARSDAYQRCDNLILERGARAQAIPKLEILTDDVKCSHGSTVGRLGEEELFYAASRGIPPAEARSLIAGGFIRRVLSGGGDWNPLAEELFASLGGRLKAAGVGRAR